MKKRADEIWRSSAPSGKGIQQPFNLADTKPVIDYKVVPFVPGHYWLHMKIAGTVITSLYEATGSYVRLAAIGK